MREAKGAAIMASAIGRFADRLFHRQEYRVDGEPVARMIKWTLISTPIGRVFFHKFNGPDWTRDPHDHPAMFISIGLKGAYVETVYDHEGRALYDRKWVAPWFRVFPAMHVHRTSWVSPAGAYTLCLTGPWIHPWGFVLGDRSIGWRDYLRRHRSTRSDRRVA
jgi:hypothetical protein